MESCIEQVEPFLICARKLIEKAVSSELVDSFRTIKLDVGLLKNLTAALQKLKAIFKQQILIKHVQEYVPWPPHLKFSYLFDNIDDLFAQVNWEAKRRKMETLTSTSQVSKKFNYRLQILIERVESSVDDEFSIQHTSLLSTCVKLLLDRLVSTEFINNFRRRTKLHVSLLENLRETLRRLKTALSDAEKNEINILIAGHWLEILRNAVFELGYFFDDIKAEALCCKVEAEYETRTATSQVLFNGGVTNSKFHKLIQRLQFFTSRAMLIPFPVPTDPNGSSSPKSVPHETPTSFFLDDESSIYYGRDTDIKKLKHLLLFSDGDSKAGIISIVGTEGIGKTTLAKLLYNDPEIYDNFELKVWAHVSKHCKDLFVLETILDDLNTNRSDMNNIYPKMLLVLDDVSDATSIRTLLLNFSNLAETGSRIIITTQDERVALSLQTFGLSMKTFLYDHYLRPLESEDCWSVLARHAFGVTTIQSRTNWQRNCKKLSWITICCSNTWGYSSHQIVPRLLEFCARN